MSKITTKKFGNVVYDSLYWTIMHDGIEHAGYMAFLGLLSFFPFLVLFVAVSGFIGQAGVGVELIHEISQLVPEHVIRVLTPRINEIISGPPQGLLTVAIIGVCWTASSIVEGTRTILNRVYHVHTPPAYIWRRLLSILQMLIFTGALIIVMLIMVLGPVVLHKIQTLFGWSYNTAVQWEYLRYSFSALMLLIIIAVSYYTLPNIKQRWISVIPGTLAVIIGWLGAAELFSLYLTNFNQLNVIYGSLGGMIASLVFLYIISMIYIFGAEFNYHFEKAIGHRIVEKVKQKRRVKKKQKARNLHKRNKVLSVKPEEPNRL